MAITLSGDGIARANLAADVIDGTKIEDDAVGTEHLANAINTDIAAKLPLAGGTMTGGLDLNDDVKARWGTGNDLEIFHDGSNSYIKDVGSGNLRIQGVNVGIGGTNDEYAIYCDTNGAVDLYHNNVSKLATTATGVTVTGVVAATTLTGDGSALTGISAGTALTGSTNNQVTTVTGANAIQGEGKLLFSSARLTVGDGTAEDAYVKFDGNEMNAYIGIDDTYNTLSIGVGDNPYHTTHALRIGEWDSQYAIRQSLQPCFSVSLSADHSNTNVGINNTLMFDTEAFDVGSNWNTTNHNFTTPISGKWLISVTYTLMNVATNQTYMKCNLTTSNRQYDHYLDLDGMDSSFFSTTITHVCDMDTDDTLSARMYPVGGSSTTDFKGGGNGCRITGWMLG